MTNNVIKANLWPFPKNINNYLKDNNISFNTIYINLNSYKKDINHEFHNPLRDFKEYMKGLHKNIIIYESENKNNNFTNSINLHMNYDSKLKLEEYKIVQKDSTITIHSNNHIGIGYGLITLSQLLTLNNNSLNLPDFKKIHDSPNTEIREVLLDVSRTYYPVKDIYEFIRINGYSKINSINFHFIDSQSFPLALGPITNILSCNHGTGIFEGLTGAFIDPNGQPLVYNNKDIINILKVAHNYGINIIPGIDFPGHLTSIQYGCKEATKELFKSDYLKKLSSVDVDVDGIQLINKNTAMYQASEGLTTDGVSKSGAPEPIIGYLDLLNYSDESVFLILSIINEILNSGFENQPKVSIDLNVDEINVDTSNWLAAIYDLKTLKNFFSKILNIFQTKMGVQNVIIEYNNAVKPHNQINKNTIDILKKLSYSLWIDTFIQTYGPDSEFLGYGSNKTNNVSYDLDDTRLIIKLWNLAPNPTLETTNKIINLYPNCKVININSVKYYLDSGHPGSNLNGTFWNNNNNNISVSPTTYWVNNYPNYTPTQNLPTLGNGRMIPWADIYQYNFHYDNIYDKNNKLSGMGKITNIAGAGLAIWSETFQPGMLNYKFITNLLAFSESTWKYNNSHLPDNVKHATVRLLYTLQKIKQKPYNITNYTPIYDESSLLRRFPMGCDMSDISDKAKSDLIKNNYQINQNWLNKHYNDWNFKLNNFIINNKTYYFGKSINNNLMYNINPDGPNGALSISQNPLNMVFLYAQSGSNLSTAINPFLCEDINYLLNQPAFGNPYSNFASSHKYSNKSKYYTNLKTKITKNKAIEPTPEN